MIQDAIEVRLNPGQRDELEARLRAGTTPQRDVLRLKIVLHAAEGTSTREIARILETTPTTVSLWRGRFAREGFDGLVDLPRSGTPPIYGAATDERIRKALDRPPPKGFSRWNEPLIAKALGDVDVQYVWRSLREQKIDPPHFTLDALGGLHAAGPAPSPPVPYSPRFAPTVRPGTASEL